MGGGYKFIKLVKEKLPHYQHILVGRPGELVSDARSFFGDKAIFILPGFFLADAIVIRKILKKIEPSVVHLHGRGAGLYGRLVNYKTLFLDVKPFISELTLSKLS